MSVKLKVVLPLIFFAALSRLLPHPPNLTAIGAMALFAGTNLPSKVWSLLVPFAALLLSDLILGFHNTMFFVYAAFALVVMLGWQLQERRTIPRVGAMSLAASLLFFVLTNFGVWMVGGYYSKDLAGLITCFVAALPFLATTVAGDAFYVLLLFGSYALLEKKWILQKAPVRKQ